MILTKCKMLKSCQFLGKQLHLSGCLTFSKSNKSTGRRQPQRCKKPQKWCERPATIISSHIANHFFKEIKVVAKACTAAGISTDVSLATFSASFKLLTAVSDNGCLRSRALLIALLPRQWSKLPTHLRISNSTLRNSRRRSILLVYSSS